MTTTQQAEARRIYEQLRLLVDSDLQQIVEFLAEKPDEQLLGGTEVDVGGGCTGPSACGPHAARFQRYQGKTLLEPSSAWPTAVSGSPAR